MGTKQRFKHNSIYTTISKNLFDEGALSFFQETTEEESHRHLMWKASWRRSHLVFTFPHFSKLFLFWFQTVSIFLKFYLFCIRIQSVKSVHNFYRFFQIFSHIEDLCLVNKRVQASWIRVSDFHISFFSILILSHIIICSFRYYQTFTYNYHLLFSVFREGTILQRASAQWQKYNQARLLAQNSKNAAWSFVYCPERWLFSLSTINVLAAAYNLCWFFFMAPSIHH